MRKILSLLLLVLLTLSGISAQTMPTLSTGTNEYWYYIRFKNGSCVIQDMGKDQSLMTKAAAANTDAQLWKVESSGASNYVITSKLGNKIAFNTTSGLFTSSATATNLVFKSTPVTAYQPAWELGRSTSSTMNQNGGAGADKTICEWSSDGNNPLEFMTVGDMRFPQPLPDKLAEVPMSGKAEAPSQKLALWYRFPSTNWMTSSLPIGNGQLGAMIFGGVKQDEIQFNEKTLWTGSTKKIGAYQNFGNIFINNNNVEEAVNYRRELDIENAICRVSYSNKGVDFLREYIASNPDSVIIIRLTASAAKQISFDLKIWDAHSCLPKYSNNTVTIDGKLDLVSYYARLTVINDGGTVSSTSDGINVKDADAVTIVLRGATDYDPSSSTYISNTATLTSRVDAAVSRASAKTYDVLKAAHVADYKHLFDRVKLDFNGTVNGIPTDELAKSYNTSVNAGGKGYPFLEMLYFHFGRYLMISASRGVDQPSNLQGIWNHINTPPWNSDIHSNINVQMNYWPAESTNLSELHLPFLNYIYNESQLHTQWKQNALDAKKAIATKLGLTAPTSAKGWTLYTENNIFGYYSTFMMNYVIANAWFCMHSWQHYRYTLDEDYLLNKAYPVMKSAAEFWLERLIQDRGKTMNTAANILKDYAPDGTLVAPLEYSPEHGPGQEDGTAHAQQLCWDLFSSTLKAMEVLGNKVSADAAFKTQLQEAFAKLDPGTTIDKDGHLREWKYTEKEAGQSGHRHTSHLMGLFPGNQISPKINKPIFDAAIKSLNARGDEGTGWSMGWRINLWARSGDAERAHKLIRGAMYLTYNTGNGGGWGGGIYENLLDAHTPFQIDGNFGATSGMAEMLLQSHTDTLDILPTLPSAWLGGKVSGLRAIGNFEVDIDWASSRATKVRIVSIKGQECRVAYPYIKNATFKDKSGTVITPVFKGNDCAIFPTVVGGEYFITFGSKLTTPEVSISSTVNGTASTAKTITVNANDNVVLKSNATVTGKYYWTGPNALAATSSDVTLNTIKTFSTGKYYLSFVGTESNVSKDSIEVKVAGAGAYANQTIPGYIEAPYYDYGGEGTAFHSVDAVNSGNYLRTDGIDVYAGSNKTYIDLKDGEWVRYTVTSTRNANFQFSVAAKPAAGSKLEILIDGVSYQELTFADASSEFRYYTLTGLKAITTGSHTVTLKATGNVAVDYLSVDHYYVTNKLTDGFYYFRVNAKNWTYSKTLTDKTKPTFQTATGADNQVWEIKKDGNRYKMTTKTGERYINEQVTFGSNDYLASWNSYNIYYNGEKYAFQNGGNSGTQYWSFDGTNTAKTADPGYPTNFSFELIPVVINGLNPAADACITIQIIDKELVVRSISSQVSALTLYSIAGSALLQNSGNTMNTHRVKPGIYILSVALRNGQSIKQKVVIA